MRKSYRAQGGPLHNRSFLLTPTHKLKQNGWIICIPVPIVGEPTGGDKEETIRIPIKTVMCKYKLCKINGIPSLKYKGET